MTDVWQPELMHLRQEVADLRRILRGLGEGVLAVDQAGILVHANPAAIGMLRMDPDASLGSHVYIAVPHPEASEAIEAVMRGGDVPTPYVREFQIDDREYSIGVRRLRTSDTEDGPVGAIAVVRDITELRALDRMRQEFFANVSHELKTPVTAIRGALETIVDDAHMTEEDRQRFLTSAVTHASRLSTLVTDLLALARIESGPGALARDPVNVMALVREVVANVAPTGQTRSVSVEVEGADELVVIGDEESLRQALSNLVDNAIAHSDDGARVAVRVVRDAQSVVLEVIDSGTGIPAEALDRIFERFYRVDAARSRARGGTGIGLSIVKHVANAHGGVVSVSSEFGAGSTFRLELPATR